MRHSVWLLLMLCACSAKPAVISPRVISRSDYVEINHKMKPHLAKAQKTLPLVRERYRQGLPEGDQLFVTVKLYDPDESFELVQVKVEDWAAEQLLGRISSQLFVVQTYKTDELINFR